MTMKSYTVYYIVKANRHKYARSMVVTAGNAREACRRCKELVYEKTGRNAFYPSTKKPERYDGAGRSWCIWEIDD